jgi:predicted P-loop ATPase/GTPase
MTLRMYRCGAFMRVNIAVEAETLTEARRIIDECLSNVSYVVIVEGELSDPIEELVAMPQTIDRGEIMVDQ